jgi:hypothetical protein
MNRKVCTFIICFLTIVFYNCGGDDIVTTNTEPSPYEIASASRGGVMFDKFWSTEAGFNQSDTNLAKFNSRPDFYKCNHCHGWDYLGRFGSYIGRAPNTDRPRVAGLNLYAVLQTRIPQHLFNAINSNENRRNIDFTFNTYVPEDPNDSAHKMPDYSSILTHSQIWDLVKFLKEGVLDVSELYNASYSGIYPTGSAGFYNIGKDGNYVNGSAYYTTQCSSCHGNDGKLILIEGMSAGEFTRTKPYQVHHKMRYGRIGSAMIGNSDISPAQLKDLYKALSDTAAFPNQQ